MATSLMSKLIAKAPKNSRADVLAQSDFFEKGIICSTPVPVLNGMLSGKLNGGLTAGLTQVVGDSRTFKTNLCLLMIAAFLNSDPEAICIFGDSEFGAGKYFKSFGIDTSRVLHIPLETIEDMAFELVPRIKELSAKDKVIIFIDSVSQLASIKEVDNAMTENSSKDMTRAAALNSFFRIIPPMVTSRNIPFLFINSFYDDMVNKYAEKHIKGGKQLFLSSDTLLMVTRSQEKEDEELVGWNFNYTMFKSRAIKEKAKFTLTVRYDGGIDRYSGMFEMAQDGGFLVSEKKGFYKWTEKSGFPLKEAGFRKSSIADTDWEKLLDTKSFNDFFYETYSLDSGLTFIDPRGEEPKVQVVINPDTGEVLVQAE
jgi:RecA/RadA recombinase